MIVIYPTVSSILLIISIIYAIGFVCIGFYQWSALYGIKGVVKLRRTLLWPVYAIALFVDMEVGKDG